MSRDTLFETVGALTELHSPSGHEGEIDAYLRERLAAHGEPVQDAAGNLVLRLGGDGDGMAALLAHKDEIGGLVKRVEPDGRLIAQTLGDAHPWIWGEGPVEMLGRHDTVLGVLSFGARHVTDESPQAGQREKDVVKWKNAWIETKLSDEQLEAAGITAGTRVVPARWRKRAVRLGGEGEYVACHALDDKVAVAMLLELGERMPQPAPAGGAGVHQPRGGGRPRLPVLRPAHAGRVAGGAGGGAGGQGVRARARPRPGADPRRRQRPDGRRAVAGAGGRRHRRGADTRHAVVSRYGSDASMALDTGRVARSACLAVPTENTHGFEIVHLDAIEACVRTLQRWLG